MMTLKVATVLVLIFCSLSFAGQYDSDILQLFSVQQPGEATYYGLNDFGSCSYTGLPPSAAGSNYRVAINSPQYYGSGTCGMCMQMVGNGTGSGADPVDGTFIVFVDNLCPECLTGDLDISEVADGRWEVEWIAVSCPGNLGGLQYQGQGSNPWYLKVQVRNHRIPVSQVEIQVSGNWELVPRTQDNFWEYQSSTELTGLLPIRVTSIDGQVLVDEISINDIVSSNVFDGNNGVQFEPIQAETLSPTPSPVVESSSPSNSPSLGVESSSPSSSLSEFASQTSQPSVSPDEALSATPSPAVESSSPSNSPSLGVESSSPSSSTLAGETNSQSSSPFSSPVVGSSSPSNSPSLGVESSSPSSSPLVGETNSQSSSPFSSPVVGSSSPSNSPSLGVNSQSSSPSSSPVAPNSQSSSPLNSPPVGETNSQSSSPSNSPLVGGPNSQSSSPSRSSLGEPNSQSSSPSSLGEPNSQSSSPSNLQTIFPTPSRSVSSIQVPQTSPSASRLAPQSQSNSPTRENASRSANSDSNDSSNSSDSSSASSLFVSAGSLMVVLLSVAFGF